MGDLRSAGIELMEERSIVHDEIANAKAEIELRKDQEKLVVEESGGMKADGNKAMMELFPMTVMESVSKVLTFGAQKYEPNNWKKVNPERYKGALLRHLAAIERGETIDPDSGLPHIDHVACNAVFLSFLEYGQC